LKIKDGDEIMVRVVPKWGETKRVELKGEVKFPGTYVISNGEKLASLLKRAGGFTQNAFVEGAFFARQSVKKRQFEQHKNYLSEINKNLSIYKAMPANAKNNVNDMSNLNEILEQALEYEPLGRINIQLTNNIDEIQQSPYNITLEDKDTLIVPTKTETVYVFGEVYSQNVFICDESKTLDEYIEMASGLTNSADADKIYIIRADGTSVKTSSSWFFPSEHKIMPGDTIVVPLHIKEMHNIALMDSVTKIFSSLALSVAALNSIGIF
jgi:protein involved in polysaccharide export with SLBB domain